MNQRPVKPKAETSFNFASGIAPKTQRAVAEEGGSNGALPPRATTGNQQPPTGLTEKFNRAAKKSQKQHLPVTQSRIAAMEKMLSKPTRLLAPSPGGGWLTGNFDSRRDFFLRKEIKKMKQTLAENKEANMRTFKKASQKQKQSLKKGFNNAAKGKL